MISAESKQPFPISEAQFHEYKTYFIGIQGELLGKITGGRVHHVWDLFSALIDFEEPYVNFIEIASDMRWKYENVFIRKLSTDLLRYSGYSDEQREALGFKYSYVDGALYVLFSIDKAGILNDPDAFPVDTMTLCSQMIEDVQEGDEREVEEHSRRRQEAIQNLGFSESYRPDMYLKRIATDVGLMEQLCCFSNPFLNYSGSSFGYCRNRQTTS